MLVRSEKNSFAPINRIPPEILSLLLDYYDEKVTDRSLITLTHVCRRWRDIFTSRSSLWTQLRFTNIDKTRAYIQRSQSSPLELYLNEESIDEAFNPVISHLHRLISLTIHAYDPQNVLGHFRNHAPLLEKLEINSTRDWVLDATLFNGDLSSLRKLRLAGVITYFPWKRLANLQVVNLKAKRHSYRTSQILDFFESAPLLHTISLQYPMPDSSDAPPDRIATLRHLKVLTINPPPPQSAFLLRHLRIPSGASLVSEFFFDGEESPLLDFLPERSPNLKNLSHITSVKLWFDLQLKYIQLSGPSGSLRVLVEWGHFWEPSYARDCKILCSLSRQMPPTVQRLTVSMYEHSGPVEAEENPIFQMLSSMSNLRTLTLIDCNYLPFMVALDPEQHSPDLVLCPNMEELIIYAHEWSLFEVNHLIAMAEGRASGGAKLSSIIFVDLGSCGQREEMFRLREHVAYVEYRIEDKPPTWDDPPGESE